nr:hypothetical protein [FCB group bacterium]
MTNKNLETILNYLTDSLILCNRDFQINESNNSARMVFGMGEDIKGSHCYELLRNRTEPCEDCPLSETIECGSLVPVNYYDKRFDEYFEERTHPILKDDDSIDGFILVAKNVTKTRQIEDQSTQSKKLAAIGQISAGIAHDFNNVLTGVLGQVELMKMRYDDAQILKHVSMIERAVLDGKATVRRMQDFTRTKKEERKESVDLKPMLVDVVAFSKPRWQKSAEKEGLIIEPVLELSDDLTVIGNASDIQ